jgi:hypothetical protein
LISIISVSNYGARDLADRAARTGDCAASAETVSHAAAFDGAGQDFFSLFGLALTTTMSARIEGLDCARGLR